MVLGQQKYGQTRPPEDSMREELLLSVDGLPVQLAACAPFLRCVAPSFHDGRACGRASGQGIPARQAMAQLPGAGFVASWGLGTPRRSHR